MKPLYKTDKFELVHFHRCMNNLDIFNSNYFEWFDDQEISAKNSHGLFPLNHDEYLDIIDDGKTGKILNWAIIVDENIHIGNISLQRIDWVNRSSEFAVVIGEKDYWGKGICTEAAKLLFSHAFAKLNLHRIWSGTAHTNLGMKKVFKKLGMTYEGSFRQAMYLQGRYVDVEEYGILRHEWDEKLAKDAGYKKDN